MTKETKNITDLNNFLTNFRELSQRLESHKIIYQKTKFSGLFNGYNSLRNLIKIYEKKDATNYNIFNVLNVDEGEVTLHTPFLANLLNPTESHGQGDIFLTSFINKFIPVNKRTHFSLANPNDYIVEEEKGTSRGYIDIFIQSFSKSKPFGIVIENKIRAGDQPKQLSRYYQYLKDKKLSTEQSIIFYLTVTGNEPTTHSIEKITKEELVRNDVLIYLSYKKDIASWLSELKDKIEAQKLKNIITQYLQIIKQL